MDELAHGSGDLILNGDTFELWQSAKDDCVYSNRDEGCTTDEALARVRIVLAAHKQEIEAIHDFAVSHDNRVYLIPGNHDVALLFPKVAAEVLSAIGAPADRVRIVSTGYWLSDDHLIYAEHGQQIGADVNKFKGWPQPFITEHGAQWLVRPWGEQFVQSFYNQFEMKYPIIDNLASETLGVKYGFAAEGVPETLKDFGLFVRFYLTQQSLLQLKQVLGEGRGVGWDIDRLRAGGNKFFYESIPDNDPLRAATRKAVDEGTLGLSVANLSDDEIKGICAIRSAEFAREGEPHHIAECPKKDFGAVIQGLVRSRESIFMEHLNGTANRLAKAGFGSGEFELYVFSHTHLAEAGYAPFQHSPSQWQPLVMNTGAWQRTIDEGDLNALINRRHLGAKDVLALQPEDLPPCYSFIVVAPYGDKEKPRGQVQYWTLTETTWSAKSRCEWAP
jgi:hypothetical protein